MNPLPPSESIDEELRKEFEKRLLSGKPGKIEDFLPAEDDPRYLGTLEELVHIEIELGPHEYIKSLLSLTSLQQLQHIQTLRN